MHGRTTAVRFNSGHLQPASLLGFIDTVYPYDDSFLIQADILSRIPDSFFTAWRLV